VLRALDVEMRDKASEEWHMAQIDSDGSLNVKKSELEQALMQQSFYQARTGRGGGALHEGWM
jgi:hypothetical protein